MVVVAVDEVGEAVVEVAKRGGRTSAVVMHKVPAAVVDGAGVVVAVEVAAVTEAAAVIVDKVVERGAEWT